MPLVAEYRDARRGEEVARLRRVLALRAMAAIGTSQREMAEALGVSQPAISQQLKSTLDLSRVHPEVLVEAAAPILRRVAEERGFTNLAVFGSVARRKARPDSDIDLLVEAPPGTTIGGLLSMQDLLERILGRAVDLITYGGLNARLDGDIRSEAVLL